MDETLLRIQQGDTWTLEILVADDQDQPVDLTGVTAKMHMRKTASSSTLVLELSTENQRLKVDAGGSIAVLVDAETTAALPAGSGVYDLEARFASGVVKKLVRGTYLVIPEVTR